MYNSERPSAEDLPSTKQLIRSTLIAIVSAIVILITIVLPSEYGIDPTGVGGALGLKEMGEIRMQLQEEAENDHHSSLSPRPAPSVADRLLGLFIGVAHAQETAKWQDEISFELKPGESNELKLVMKKGAVAAYQMIVEGGRVNFDLHAHEGSQNVTYDKGRGSRGAEGEIVAAFDGDHGWFWRNRDKSPLMVTLKLRGAYSAIK